MMSGVQKYAALPDLVSKIVRLRLFDSVLLLMSGQDDAAPDIYETPDLTDGTSTLPVSNIASFGGDALDIDVCSRVQPFLTSLKKRK